MSPSAALPCAALLALSLPGQIQLPPPPAQTGVVAPVQRPLSEVELFRRGLQDLLAAPVVVERTLQQMAEEFPDVEALIVQRLRPAGPRELLCLMVAAQRFHATPKVRDEIVFQLLARPVGDVATRAMVDTLVALEGASVRQSLQTLIRGRIAGVRRAATDVYTRFATAADLDFALVLADDQKLDLRLSGVDLLAAVPAVQARQRLCELLAQEPTVAGAACQALIRVGADAVPLLRRILSEPPIDRSYAYAAFALVAGNQAAQLPPESAPGLERALSGADPLARSLAAVALAELCWSGRAAEARDDAVVDALLDIVVPAAFVPNLDMLRPPAALQLQQLTGRDGSERVGWREWWQGARPTFAGMRARLDVDRQNARAAVVTLREPHRVVRLVGEGLADLDPQQGSTEYVLDTDAMLRLVEELRQAGFMQPGAVAVPAGVAAQRHLQLVIGRGRTQMRAPAAGAPAFDVLAAIVDGAGADQLWQQMRHPVEEPARGAFWRAERDWLARNEDPLERGRRLVQRATRVWNVVAPAQRDLFLTWLLEQPQRRELIGEADGLAMVELVRGAAEIGERELVLLELATSAPGDSVWLDAVEVATGPGGGRRAVERLFAVLGPDRVLRALGDGRPQVRRAALDEVVRLRDARAAPAVLELFGDGDPGVQRAAVYAAGMLELAAAQQPLLDRIIADDTKPELRRDALVALGRVGGAGAFPVLQRALEAREPEDRDAALRGLGELEDARAAAQLASIFAAAPEGRTRELARHYLQRMGSRLAVPALRSQLETRNAAVRNQLVLLLGGYQDPRAVPDLLELLRMGYEPLITAAMIEGTTGLDTNVPDDLAGLVERWYQEHRNEPQWRWLMAALDKAGVPHAFEAGQFAVGAGLQAVPELARIMVDAEAGRLRVLAAAVLRDVTGEDYGQVLPGTPVDVRQAIAARYRELYENARAARGR